MRLLVVERLTLLCTYEEQRNFRFVSIVGFVMILQSTWESVLL